MLSILALTAFSILRLRGLFTVAMMSGIYSLTAAIVFLVMDAVDVAFTEAAVGAGVATVLMLATLAHTGVRAARPAPVSWIGLAAVIGAGLLLVAATLEMPALGSAEAPANLHVRPRYLNQSMDEVGVPNVVTSVLASYRGYDTMGEVTVIFAAGIGVFALLGRGRRTRGTEPPEDKET
ncbi:MAG: DUF4040 domain-containing protein [Pseudomonadota bacterium]